MGKDIDIERTQRTQRTPLEQILAAFDGGSAIGPAEVKTSAPSQPPLSGPAQIDPALSALIGGAQARLARMFASPSWRAEWDERHTRIGNLDGWLSVQRVTDEIIMGAARAAAARSDVEAAKVNCALAVATATGQHWRPWK